MGWIVRNPPAAEPHLCAVPTGADRAGAGEKSVWECNECLTRWVLLNRPRDTGSTNLEWRRQGGWSHFVKTGVLPHQGQIAPADS